MSLMNRISDLRRKKKLSQHQLAEMIGVSRSALAQWETGLSTPRYKNLKRIAALLSVSFEWLATGNEIKEVDIDSITCNTGDVELHQKIHEHLLSLDQNKKKAILDIIREIQ